MNGLLNSQHPEATVGVTRQPSGTAKFHLPFVTATGRPTPSKMIRIIKFKVTLR
jgi:hypothetical protein